MKKLLLLTASVLVFLGHRAYSGESINSPYASGTGGSINADYGGVDYWGTTFSNFVTTVALPVTGQNPSGSFGYYASTTFANAKTSWRIYGVNFSTGNCGGNDFAEVFQSTGGFVAVNSSATLRFYNNIGSTATAAGNNISACSGVALLRWPFRMNGNIFFKPSSNGYNQVQLLYWKEPD